MNWSMPPRVLRVVAVLIVLCALGGFAAGLTTAGGRGRLPGEVTPGGAGAALVATDAQPLNLELPPPPPPPPEPDPEVEKAKAEAEAAKLQLAQAKAAAERAARAAEPVAAPADKVGDLLDAVTPPPAEDPPF